MEWTSAQKKVIETRNKNILVSAAAGSGKTAVLVERIISRILDKENPAGIDRMLVVTFTNAAAAEMRERILRAIMKAAAAEPDNEYLQKQITYLHNATIATIDSFCQTIVRENFNKIDIDPSFRMATEDELELIKQDVMDATLEAHFAEGDKDFLDFTEARGGKNFERTLSEIILNLYKYSRSNPNPHKWLDECRDVYDISKDIFSKPWFVNTEDNVRRILSGTIKMYEEAIELSIEPNGPFKYTELLKTELEGVLSALECDDYFAMSEKVYEIEFVGLPRFYEKDNVDIEAKDRAQNLRNQCKKIIQGTYSKCYKDKETLENELKENYRAVCVIVKLVKSFDERFSQYKRERNIADFTDVEHMALKILTDTDENGNVCPSEVAKELSDNYDEIMIDEYQDSNLVQEYLLTAVSGNSSGINNMFMVGDVKQSIYKFRMAKPELFLSKYNSFPSTDEGDNIRITLDKNFRSRKEIVDIVNLIFMQIMGKNVGGIDYDDDHSLKLGADYKDINSPEEQKAEFIVIEEDGNASESIITEANVISHKIKELIRSGFKVTDKATGQGRPIRYSDIAILTRALAGSGDVISDVLMENGIPTYVEKTAGYFDTLEISTMLNMLSVIDNPHQDIPVVAVLKNIFMLTSKELAVLSMGREGDMYDAVIAYVSDSKEKDPILYEKVSRFGNIVSTMRVKSKYMSISDIIEDILEETGYGYYISTMSSGDRRSANLKMLISKAEEYESTSFTGLFNFVRYISNIKKYEVETGEAASVNENDDSVRIMTIHKSKGLEYPVVFVSFTGKQFKKNTRSIIIHEKYGIGLDYIDVERRTKKSNCVKRIIAEELKKEDMAEELRILYVALTRAKEKLIVTGTAKYEKLMQKAEEYKGRYNVKLDGEDVLQCQSYLEWICIALADYEKMSKLKSVEGEKLTVESRVLDNIYADSLEKLLEKENIEQFAKKEELSTVNPCMFFDKEYKHIDDTKLNSKYSVSEIKKMIYEKGVDDEDEGQVELYAATHKKESYVPAFIKEREELKGAGRGTAYHRIFELINYEANPESKEDIAEQMDTMVKKGYIDEEAAAVVDAGKIFEFVTSDIGKRMKKAAMSGQLFREQQYVMGVKASDIHEDYNGEEIVLVQGAIDAYFIENGKVIIVDYKTDNVSAPEQLITLYKGQLDYYGKAIRAVTGMEVEEKIIYSVKFGKEISV